MARPTSQMKELARIGTAARLEQLTNEIAAIRKALPASKNPPRCRSRVL